MSKLWLVWTLSIASEMYNIIFGFKRRTCFKAHFYCFDLFPTFLFKGILILNRFWLIFLYWICLWFTDDCWDSLQIKQYWGFLFSRFLEYLLKLPLHIPPFLVLHSLDIKRLKAIKFGSWWCIGINSSIYYFSRDKFYTSHSA